MGKIRLFVPLGTQKFPFGRIITALNQLVDQGKYKDDEIVMQSALYPIQPKFTHFGLIPNEDFNRYMREAEVVVTHSGVNSIISCMEMDKPLVVCPRLHEYGEHVDNHQMEIATLMRDKYDVLICTDMKDLPELIKKAKTHKYKPWVSHRVELLEAIRRLII
ncbi:exopolysaccharide biosynthesis protein [Bacteroides gallinaceum]|uniref:glycosyltransferase n=1 Tax=Bacteroides gallinaceum TaxID=1462571 RepID=UPI0019561438|nr:glycosyltransferase [Bacteroides gallinaceum]MBM6721406.1 exopolysaccharide biosynthesis protein [Bacteroides gallinaceum]